MLHPLFQHMLPLYGTNEILMRWTVEVGDSREWWFKMVRKLLKVDNQVRKLLKVDNQRPSLYCSANYVHMSLSIILKHTFWINKRFKLKMPHRNRFVALSCFFNLKLLLLIKISLASYSGNIFWKIAWSMQLIIVNLAFRNPKSSQLQGTYPWPGALPLDPTGSKAPRPQWSLALPRSTYVAPHSRTRADGLAVKGSKYA